jgi:cytochrome c553
VALLGRADSLASPRKLEPHRHTKTRRHISGQWSPARLAPDQPPWRQQQQPPRRPGCIRCHGATQQHPDRRRPAMTQNVRHGSAKAAFDRKQRCPTASEASSVTMMSRGDTATTGLPPSYMTQRQTRVSESARQRTMVSTTQKRLRRPGCIRCHGATQQHQDRQRPA